MLIAVDGNLVLGTALNIARDLPRHRIARFHYSRDQVGDHDARFDLIGSPTVHVCVKTCCSFMPDLDLIPGDHDAVAKVATRDRVAIQFTNDLTGTAHAIALWIPTPHILVNVCANAGGDAWEVATWLRRVAESAFAEARAA